MPFTWTNPFLGDDLGLCDFYLLSPVLFAAGFACVLESSLSFSRASA
jgi:hypothetical protein